MKLISMMLLSRTSIFTIVLYLTVSQSYIPLVLIVSMLVHSPNSLLGCLLSRSGNAIKNFWRPRTFSTRLCCKTKHPCFSRLHKTHKVPLQLPAQVLDNQAYISRKCCIDSKREVSSIKLGCNNSSSQKIWNAHWRNNPQARREETR